MRDSNVANNRQLVCTVADTSEATADRSAAYDASHVPHTFGRKSLSTIPCDADLRSGVTNGTVV